MRAGTLKHRLAVYQPVKGDDAYGQSRYDPSTDAHLGTIWGNVRSATANEKVIGQQLKQVVSHAIETRWQGASMPLKATQYAVFNGRILNFVSVQNVDERNRKYIIYANEIASP